MRNCNTAITALILAGGRATRMDGYDKGLLSFGKKLFIEHLVDRMTDQVDTVMINANRNHEIYQNTGCQVIEDKLAGFQGPLAGMLAGLNAMHTPWLLTLPCDGPFVAKDYAQRMLTKAVACNCQLAVASDGCRLQPVYALIHSSLAASLAHTLAAGERKIDRWFAKHPFNTVSFEDHTDMFVNVNTPEELAELKRYPIG